MLMAYLLSGRRRFLLSRRLGGRVFVRHVSRTCASCQRLSHRGRKRSASLPTMRRLRYFGPAHQRFARLSAGQGLGFLNPTPLDGDGGLSVARNPHAQSPYFRARNPGRREQIVRVLPAGGADASMVAAEGKRGRAAAAAEEEQEDVGPALPPPGGADSDSEEENVGPAMPPKQKKKKVLPFEQAGSGPRIAASPSHPAARCQRSTATRGALCLRGCSRHPSALFVFSVWSSSRVGGKYGGVAGRAPVERKRLERPSCDLWFGCAMRTVTPDPTPVPEPREPTLPRDDP